jgi:predicted flavoprotein YhiN
MCDKKESMNKVLRQEFKEGEIVILDDKHEVKVVQQTSGKLFTKVMSEGAVWDVMTYRLKPKPIN